MERCTQSPRALCEAIAKQLSDGVKSKSLVPKAPLRKDTVFLTEVRELATALKESALAVG